MSELRRDPFRNRWVNVSPSRAGRPTDLEGESSPCPFCPGNESLTPLEILAIRPPGSPTNGPGWQLRVVNNLYPALEPNRNIERSTRGVYERMEGAGHHELVIETPDHDRDLDALADDQMARVIRTHWSRLEALEEDPSCAYVLVFRNWGKGSGASLAHPHAQILAMPVVPDGISTEITRSVQYFGRTGRPLSLDMLNTEREKERRIIIENERFIALAPYASAYPFEIALYPKDLAASFKDLIEADVAPLGSLLQQILARMKRALNDPAYNIVLHTAPNPQSSATSILADPAAIEAAFHWHMEIVPRLHRVDGFEWATGMFINTVPPEDAARILRETDVSPAHDA